LKKVGIVYHPRIAAAKTLAEQLVQAFPSLNTSIWLCSAWEEERVRIQAPGTDLVLSIGGDGTILRVARAVTPWEIPILGINLGKLGFMTELRAEEVTDKLPPLLAGEGLIDKRTMLQAELLPEGEELRPSQLLHALNDVLVGRGEMPRVIYVKVTIDGDFLATYKADGVLIATATGSTGYCLAAQGPILYPQAEEMVLKPIAAHLAMAYALVLPPTATIELEIHTDHQAMLSLDGQLNFALHSGDKVRVKRSPYIARFLRFHPPTSFYSMLEHRLRGASEGREGQNL
jgi:NAD+ kinase